MLNILEECARFKITSRRIVNLARMIVKESWFYDFQILEIHQQAHRESCQQDPNTKIATLNTKNKNITTELKRKVIVIETSYSQT